jgi:periplasmic protein TonB
VIFKLYDKSRISLFAIICTFSFFLPTNALSSIQDDGYLAFAEVMPEPAEGLAELFKKISYPDIAKRTGVEGKVYLLIYVNETGNVDEVKVVKSLGAGCDEAAINAVKKTKFKPGKNGGVPIKVKLSLPVTFKLK